MLYAACEGRKGDMERLEASTAYDYFMFLELFLERSERMEREAEKLAGKSSGAAPGKSKTSSTPKPKR